MTVRATVSLRNRTDWRRGRENAWVWQTRRGYYVGVLSWSSLYTNVSGLSQKELAKEKRSLAKIYFKQNYCHACHTRFAVFFPLSSCCVSSLVSWLAPCKQSLYFLNEVEKRRLPWSRRDPTFSTGQSCFLSSKWFFDCEHPFIDLTDGYNWARYTKRMAIKPRFKIVS